MVLRPHVMPVAHVVRSRIHDSIHDARGRPPISALPEVASVASLIRIYTLRGQDGVCHSVGSLFGLVSSDVVADSEVPCASYVIDFTTS